MGFARRGAKVGPRAGQPKSQGDGKRRAAKARRRYSLLGAGIGVGIPHATGGLTIGLAGRPGERGTGKGESRSNGEHRNENLHGGTLRLITCGDAGAAENVSLRGLVPGDG